MAVVIRLQRTGKTNRAYYRIGAFDKRVRRDGRALELLGHYHPVEKNKEVQVKLNRERIEYWLSKGAKPSDTIKSLCKKHGITVPVKAKKKKKKKVKAAAKK